MSKLNLLSMGQVIDQIKQGQIAVSIHPDDEGTIVAVDKDNWLKIKYPERDSFRYEHFFRIDTTGNVPELRWLIMKEPENFIEDGVVYAQELKKSLEDK